VAAIRTITAAVAVCLATAVPLVAAAPAQASTATDAQAAAQLAAAHGYRVGIAVLDLSTGQYTGAGDDAGTFASQSVVKVLIATQLLFSGQMTGQNESLARAMIAASDDQAADVLYPRAGGADVLPRVAAHYGIAGLGAPTTSPGMWGFTQISAKGLVSLYAAIARDPAVYPWLSATMAGAPRIAADGTDQFFGLPAVAPGSAIKQGWGHELDGAAVANTTGYLSGGRLAVAILTSGPRSTYLAQIAAEVTAETQTVFAGGLPASPAAAPAAPAPAAAGTPAAAAPHRDLRLALIMFGLAAAGALAFGAVHGARRLRAVADTRRLRQAEERRKRALAAAARTGTMVLRLPDGRLVRVTTARPRPTRTGPAVVHGRSATVGRVPATRAREAVPA
jgi:hypothetical protein